MEIYTTLKMALAVVATIGLYSVLYRENKFYRFWEHVFVGLAAGWALVALWTDTLETNWWDRMWGAKASVDNSERMGYWAYAILLPISLMGYMVFSKKHNWMSRIPIGIILGFYSGQQLSAWQQRYPPAIADSMKPILPTTGDFFRMPAQPGVIAPQLTISEALSNLVFVVTLVSVLSYFLFSFDIKNQVLKGTSLLGRWLLMIGFGAIFGNTVMMRFTLLIDRMFFIWIEFFRDRIFHG